MSEDREGTDEAIREQLSASADDQLSAREQELLIRRLTTDEALAARWLRYHRIGDLIREPRRMAGAIQAEGVLAARVSAALAEEPALASGELDAEPGGLLRHAAGLAIAAGVMVVAIMVMRGPVPGTDLSPVADSPTAVSQDDGSAVRPASMRGQREALMRQRMESYLINHSEHAASTRPAGVLEFANVTSSDTLGAGAAAGEAEDDGTEQGEEEARED